MEFYVNGDKVTAHPVRGSKPGWKMTMSYEQVSEMAGLIGCMPTVSWRLPNKTHGILSPGERVQVVEGMQFDACVTGCA